VIPHTWEQTTLQHLSCGDAVNLEADLLAKYVERLLPGSASTDLTSQWLAENGWSV
jgi:riboflavin synthase